MICDLILFCIIGYVTVSYVSLLFYKILYCTQRDCISFLIYTLLSIVICDNDRVLILSYPLQLHSSGDHVVSLK